MKIILYDKMVRACIFDLGGTIVDKFSITPLLSLKNTFQKQGIFINDKLIFKDMGKNKLDHIKDILDDPVVSRNWMHKFGTLPGNNDANMLFNDFNEIQEINCKDYMDILPETKKTLRYLKENNIKTGVTTGFNKTNMLLVKDKLEKENIMIDNYVSSTCLNLPARPSPSMVIENMKKLNVLDPRDVIKVDDTVVGIQEGKNADCWTVGVSMWSTNMKIKSMHEAEHISRDELKLKNDASRYILLGSGADYVIDNLNELPSVISKINSQKKDYFIVK